MNTELYGEHPGSQGEKGNPISQKGFVVWKKAEMGTKPSRLWSNQLISLILDFFLRKMGKEYHLP
jgi:hypothetical protein